MKRFTLKFTFNASVNISMSVSVQLHLCLIMWANCAYTFVGVQNRICASRCLGLSVSGKSVRVCQRSSSETSGNICLAWVWRPGVQRRRILSVTLWSFSGWQMIAGPVAANTFYEIVVARWHAPKTNISDQCVFQLSVLQLRIWISKEEKKSTR